MKPFRFYVELCFVIYGVAAITASIAYMVLAQDKFTAAMVAVILCSSVTLLNQIVPSGSKNENT